MTFDLTRLADALPAVLLRRDAEEGARTRAGLTGSTGLERPARLGDDDPRGAEDFGPLLTLLSIVAEQVRVLEDDLDRSYDDLFAETCDPWVLPYLGDLLGTDLLRPTAGAGRPVRRELLATVPLRRRKGTVAALESVVASSTGLPALVVESGPLLAGAQHLGRLPVDGGRDVPGTTDLRDGARLADVGGPFDRLARSVDVRRSGTCRPGARRGGGTLTDLRVFLWRVAAVPRTGTPFAVPGPGPGRRFVVHPLGRDLPLYRRPLPPPGLDERADRRHTPTPITRRELHADPAAHYGPDASLVVLVDGVPVDVADVDVCNLADLPSSGTGGDPDADPDTANWQLPAAPARRVIVDPERGRLVLADDLAGEVAVRYHAGAVADLGGGEYDRRAGLSVLDGLPAVVAEPGPGLPAALATLDGTGVAVLDTGRTLAGPVTMAPRPGATLALVAANGRNPVLALTGDLTILTAPGSTVVLDGLIVASGAVRVTGPASGRATLVLRDVTLVPGRSLHRDGSPVAPGAPSLVVGEGVDVRAGRTVTGGVVLARDATLSLVASAVDAARGVAVAGPDGATAGRLDADRATVLGRVRVTGVGEVTDSLLVGVPGEPASVTVERRQSGCVRFSFVPADAAVPRRFRCPTGAAPDFTSVRYGDPGYLQLASATSAAIRGGAEDESEPGVHHDLQEPARLANLAVRLAEFLPAAMDAGVCVES